MLPEDSQGSLRETHHVEQVSLDRLYNDLEHWGGNGQLRDLLQQCGPPGNPNGITRETLENTLRHPPFAEMPRPQQMAAVAAITRLSLKFHRELEVGSLHPDVDNPNHPSNRPLDHDPSTEEGKEKQDRQKEARDKLATNMDAKGHQSAGSYYHQQQPVPDRNDVRKELKDTFKEDGRKYTANVFKELTGDNKGDWSNRNYAVVEVHDPETGQTHYLSDSSLPMGTEWSAGVHSEPHVLDYLNEVNRQREADGKPPLQPQGLYTEREPCGPASGNNCSAYLGHNLPKDVPIYYGTGFRRGRVEDEAEMRAEGRQDEIRQIKDDARVAFTAEGEAYVNRLKGLWLGFAGKGLLS
ncbi:nucleic acid/nucleotide deaminase domain-containing protein [Streptomyces endophytica]|uniref:Uncharacterized protein n=1 Tax=Streptomyces endophytica TaxID=2991496 RepID=A0ABY6PDK7_9ACTN|nr:nucleic acid/nucleotide deaminase domain-containing protein [Streptomyces endophytica]UZJ31302.1 hypothetical protein OJ254_14470 [Streptomyces endophytica]